MVDPIADSRPIAAKRLKLPRGGGSPVTAEHRLRWRAPILVVGVLFLSRFAGSQHRPDRARIAAPPVTLAAALSEDMCSWPSARGPWTESDRATPGGEVPPLRYVMDPYPTFNGIAIDVQNNRVVMSDENRKSVLTYDRRAGSNSTTITPPLRQIIGPQTEIGYISAVWLDPARRELYVVNNDIEDRIVVFEYDAHGNLAPKRRLYVPHQSWGISLNPEENQLAISIQQLSTVAIYRREAVGLEAPLRIIKGPHTGLADPHGIHWDVAHHEIVVASHGNHSVIAPYSAYDPAGSSMPTSVAGHFLPPSLVVFGESATGDTRPLRTIQGSHTQLDWPMGIDIDQRHNEIVVANNGDDSVLIFDRTAEGDARPARVLRGLRTGISSPVGVAIDVENDELWVANYGDHTALVFSRTATGDIPPKRIIRNAPAGSPTGGFGNPYAVAYDSKRDELLVPN